MGLLSAVLPIGGCVAYGYGDARDLAEDAHEGIEGTDAGDSASEDGGMDGRVQDASRDAEAVKTDRERPLDGGSDALTDAEGNADAGQDAGANMDAGQDAAANADAGQDAGANADAGQDAGANVDAGQHGDAEVCAETPCDARCDMNGTFALRVVVPVTWPRTSAVEAGSGNWDYWFKLTSRHERDEMETQLLECGRVGPHFQLWQVAESHYFYYPATLFDDGILSEVPVTIALGDSTPESSLQLPPVALLLGIDMPDPLNDPWPSSAAEIPADMRVDTDGDGKGGVEAYYWNEEGFVFPRTSSSIFAYNRTHNVTVAARLTLSLGGTLTSCDTSVGEAHVGQVNTRVYGCERTTETGCSATEAEFMDRNLLAYTVGASTYSLSRIADDMSCSDMRKALP